MSPDGVVTLVGAGVVEIFVFSADGSRSHSILLTVNYAVDPVIPIEQADQEFCFLINTQIGNLAVICL